MIGEVDYWESLINITGVMLVLLSACAFLIYVERKIAAWIQDRYGPNRVGPKGLFQSIADGLKFLFKEDVIPQHVDKPLYLLAPGLAIITALLAFSVVPFAPTPPPPLPPNPQAATDPATAEAFLRQVAQYRESYHFIIAPGLSIGVLFVLAVGSLNVYAVLLGGWAANNKYSLLGALRSTSQLISYEIPLALSLVGIFMMCGSLNLERIVAGQFQTEYGPGTWFVLTQPLAFLLFLVSVFAECNRLPFDLPEAEQELVGGYHTEYSALKFAMFFLAEYTHMITVSFLISLLFLGGWHFPFLENAPWFVKTLILFAKVAFFIVFFMIVRWTIPRFRFDQLMGLAWRVMIPLALVNLAIVMFTLQFAWPMWVMPIASVVVVILAGAWVSRPKRPANIDRRRRDFSSTEPVAP